MSVEKIESMRARRLSRSLLSAVVVACLSAHAGAQEVADAEDREKKVTSLDEITVKGKREYTSPVTIGGKIPLSPREIPNSVSVITQRRIEDQNLVTVEDALRFVTGVTSTPNNGIQGQYRARGHVLALQKDGVPSYGALSGYQQLDLAVYERLEVLRGPAGVLQGSGEPGGVLNVVRKRGLDEFAGSVSLSAGSWSNYRGTVDVGGPLNAEGTLRGRFVALAHDRDYEVEITNEQKWLGYGALDWDLGDSTTLGLAIARQRTDVIGPNGGLPSWSTGQLLDVPRSTTVAQDWEYSGSHMNDYVLDLEHRFSNGWIGKFSISRRDHQEPFKDAYPTTGVDPVTNTLSYARREYLYEYRREAFDLYFAGPVDLFGRTHTFLVGYNDDRLDTENAGVALTTAALQLHGIPFDRPDLVPDFDLPFDRGGLNETRQKGLYAQGRFSLAEPATLVVGGRWTDFDVRTRNQVPGAAPGPWIQGASADGEFTPYAGFLYDINKTYTAYASYADIFIPQAQLKADGTPLDPRVGKQFEVGSKAEFFDGRLIASLALFKLRDTGRSLADPNAVGFFVNAGEVESKGWEVEVTGSPAPGYELQAGYTRQQTEWIVATAALQGLEFSAWEPKHTFKLWAVRRFSEGPVEGLTFGFGFNTISGYEAGTGTAAIRSIGGHTFANAMASYRFNDHFSLVFNVNNITDKVYYTRLGGLNSYNTYGDPRNYALTARISF
ncbi:MAG: TonB-dependent siderophore receptor [Luteimonas sp.]|nr:TonB-dependent siderophore receptor [Luteimonas sp.]